MNPRIRRVALLLASIAAAAASLLLTATPALAAPGPYSFSTSFGSSGSGAGQLSLVATGNFSSRERAGSGLAVDDTTGDVYVADTGNHRVDQFTSSGAFVRAWGWGVKNGAEEFQTCTEATTCQAGLSGSNPGQFEDPTFIAVDNSTGFSKGDVYVADPADKLISKFNEEGKLVSNWGKGGQLNGSAAESGPFHDIIGIATDPSGNLFVFDTFSQNLFEFAQSGTADPTVLLKFFESSLAAGLAVDTAGHFYKASPGFGLLQYNFSGEELGGVGTGEAVSGFAVDLSDNNIYVGDEGGTLISRYDSSCKPASDSCREPVDAFGSAHLSEAAGLAVDPSAAHTVYAANVGANDIVLFTAPVVPAVTANPASKVEPTSATLNGHLIPEGGEVTGCKFEYVTHEAFNHTEDEVQTLTLSGATGGTYTLTFEGKTTAPIEWDAPAEGAGGVGAALEALPGIGGEHGRRNLSVSGEAGGPYQIKFREQLGDTNVPQLTADSSALTPPGTATVTTTTEGDDGWDTATILPCAEGENFKTESNVHADIAELELSAETTYDFRLDASNANGRGQGDPETFTTLPAVAKLSTEPATKVERKQATLNGSFEGNGKDTKYRFEYVTAEHFNNEGFTNATSTEEEDAGSPAALSHKEVSFELAGLQLETEYHYRILATSLYGTTVASNEKTFTTLDAVTSLTTGPATAVTNESATLNGSFTGEEGLATKYFFEYGTTTHYDHKTPLAEVPASALGPQHPSASIENLVPGTAYHYRIVASNEPFGATDGEDETFITEQPPTIEGFSSSEVTATTAVLHAQFNPQVHPGGVEAECRFEYGTTTAYGQSEPCPEKLSGTTGRSVKVKIENLQPGVTYHFRLLAENKWGSVTSEDQSFEFFPPACPNSAVRQQTGSAYLPDCRAYELVSPGNANGTLLYPRGPNTGQATSPSRFSFVGAFSSLPGVGEVIGTTGDLYVATRTDTGWVSSYVGLPGNQAGCVGGPPNSPWSHASPFGLNQDFVFADPAMDRFLDFNDGNSLKCFSDGNGTGDANRPIDPASNAPYLWSSEGALLAHLPTDFAATPGAAAALACPDPGNPGAVPVCSGDVAASGDLTHLAFSSNEVDFAEGEEAGNGLTEAPGSAYDNDVATGTVKLISVLQNGHNIPQDPSFATVPRTEPEGHLLPGGKEEFLRFPAVSTDGSRILMSTATAPTPSCNGGGEQPWPYGCPRFTDTPIHLYMRVNDLATYEIAENKTTGEPAAVNYVGVTPDASKVYFTSEEHLTHEDEGHTGTSLFMWSAEKAEEGKEPLTLISKADPGSAAQSGDTAACEPALVETAKVVGQGSLIYEELPWVAQCGVLPYSNWSYASAQGGRGGNSISDSGIAANGDIYFYSPEQLDGDRGILGQQNLYDYRYQEGKVRFVATFAPGHTCATGAIEFSAGPRGGLVCSAGPIARLEVSADDSHMAFVTADQVTSYDNTDPHGSCQDNFGSGEPTGETQCTEMYSYTPASGAIVCDSCNPDGQPPSTDVWASQDGLFMTEDGRTFFSTSESLVPSDTNRGTDVYEFVDGRPQLITPGTGTATAPPGVNLISLDEVPGLVGVSANGTDVYFSTYDTLTSEDHNGDFLKFYDARTDGGFPQPPPTQPCVAAEECHGPGTEAPTLPQITSNGATTKGGNAIPEKNHAHKHKKRKRAKHKRHNHRANAKRGGRR